MNLGNIQKCLPLIFFEKQKQVWSHDSQQYSKISFINILLETVLIGAITLSCIWKCLTLIFFAKQRHTSILMEEFSECN